VVGVALDGDRGSDPLREKTVDDQDPPPLVEVRLDTIAELHGRGRLDRRAVDVDVPAAACRRGLGARLGQPDGVQPLVDADGVDVRQSASPASIAGPASRQTQVMRMRLRQIVMVAADLAAAEDRIEQELGLERCYRDPGVATFGLRNALFPIGDQFLEVVSPTQPDTTAGRQIDKRGGDSGYMVIIEVDDLEPLRRRFDEHGARIVYEAVADGIVGLHLHPADVGGAILSVDRADTWGEWPWAGPVWREHVRTGTVNEVLGVVIEADDPAAMSARWAQLLGCDAVDEVVTLPDGGEIRFVPTGDSGEGVSGFVLRADGEDQARSVTICNCRFDLVADS